MVTNQEIVDEMVLVLKEKLGEDIVARVRRRRLNGHLHRSIEDEERSRLEELRLKEIYRIVKDRFRLMLGDRFIEWDKKSVCQHFQWTPQVTLDRRILENTLAKAVGQGLSREEMEKELVSELAAREHYFQCSEVVPVSFSRDGNCGMLYQYKLVPRM